MMSHRFESFRASHWSGFALIFLVALLLRIYAIGQESLWIDEIRTYWFSSSTWDRIWVDYPTLEVHPPLYFALQKIWISLLGTSEGAMRSLAVMFSLCALFLVYLTARLVTGEKGKWPAWTAATLFAIATQQIHYAQEVRFYAALTMAFALLIYGTVWFLKNPQNAVQPIWKVRRIGTIGAYGGLAIGSAFLMWFHSLGALYNLSFALIIFVWWITAHRASAIVLLNFIIVMGVAVAIYSPNLGNLFNTVFGMHEGGYWLKAPSFERLGELFAFTYGFDQPEQNKVDFGLTAIVVALGVIGTYGLWTRVRKDLTLALVIFAGMPFFLSASITYLLQPTLLDRTLLPMFAPWSVLVGASVLVKLPYRAVTVALIAVLGAYAIYAVDYYKDTRKEPWRDVVKYVEMNAKPDEPVFLMNNIVQIAFNYYLRNTHSELDLRPLPAPFPANSDVYSYPIGGHSEPAVTDARAKEAFDQAAGSQRIWMVARSSFRFEETDGYLENYYATHADCTMLAVPGNLGILVYRYDNPSIAQKYEKPSCGFEGDKFGYLPF
tara:strand:+ start:3475 stop:5121 length:1647 start_codon:yes stop_codon:yes gene_type:complete